MLNQEAFDTRPKVKQKKRLNPLPENPEKAEKGKAVGPGRFPSWLHRKLPKGNNLLKTSEAIGGKRLHSVCEEARCPNLLECWSKKTATFLLMGKECTRACGFCDIDFAKQPEPLDPKEPERVADSVKTLGLKHVVMTMVARDDQKDGGAKHLVAVMEAVRKASPSVTIELLTSDFEGNHEAWDRVLEAEPEIFNYNVETVRELTPKIRHKATYDRTLELLSYVKAKKRNATMKVKSGIMVGLGETAEQVKKTIDDLCQAGCDIITIGQYLQPNHHKLIVKEFVTPERFEEYKEYGLSIGVKFMHCGPFVRSSYNAEAVLKEVQKTS